MVQTLIFSMLKGDFDRDSRSLCFYSFWLWRDLEKLYQIQKLKDLSKEQVSLATLH